MKDRMMLGEKDFQRAVLVVVLLLVTLVCLHIFVMKTDAAEMPKIFTSTTSVENQCLIQEGNFQSRNYQFTIT